MSKGDSNSVEIDYTKVFPDSKIKAVLLEEETIGRLPAKAITTLNAASAIFLQELVEVAARNDGSEPTVEDIKRAIQDKEEFHFLQGVLDDLQVPQDSSASLQRKRKATVQKKVPPKKKIKAASLVQDPMEQALEVAPTQSKARKKEIEVDEEDYDWAYVG